MSQHPKGLYLLFFTEMWERFGFYALQTVIVLYMAKGLGFSDAKSDLLYGTFSSMLYLTPPIGGYLADKFLGFQRSIIVGGFLLMLGYIFTALPSEYYFFVGLSILIVGNGLFKPNVSSIVGALYEPGDSRRDAGFTIFYMGINIGSLIPPLFIGAMVAAYGWHSGLSTAAIGMLFGMIIFISGKSRLQHHGTTPCNSPLLKDALTRFKFNALFYASLVVAVLIFHETFAFPLATDAILGVVSALFIATVLYFLFKEPKEQQRKMLAALVLIAISVGFWALYNQTFTSLILYAARSMNKNLLGFHINAEFTQFYNPFFIIVLSPILSKLWIRLASKGKNPSIPMKFALGVLFMAFGFLLIGFASTYWNHNGITSGWWLISSYGLQTVGELLLSPIGLSMITMLAPKHLVGMMMGIWFLALAAAFAIGSGLATYAAVPKTATNLQATLIYGHAFTWYGLLAIGLTVFSFVLVPFLNKLIK